MAEYKAVRKPRFNVRERDLQAAMVDFLGWICIEKGLIASDIRGTDPKRVALWVHEYQRTAPDVLTHSATASDDLFAWAIKYAQQPGI